MGKLPDNLLLTGIIGDVIDNKDPEGLGRVIAEVNAIGNRARLEWAYPIGMPGAGNPQRGFYWPPEIGSSVWIMFEMGEQTRPVYLAGPPTMPGGVSEVPTSMGGQKRTVPNTRGWETGRFEAVFDDDTAEMRVKDKTKGSFFKLKDDGSFEANDGGNLSIKLDRTAGKITITDTENTVLLDGLKVTITDKNGQVFKTDGLGKLVVGSAAATFVEIIEGATEPLVLGAALSTLWASAVAIFGAHVHDNTQSAASGNFSGIPATVWPAFIPGTHSSLRSKTAV